VKVLTIDMGANDPNVGPTSFTNINGPFENSGDDGESIAIPDVSSFNPRSKATLADDWLTIAANTLQDDIGLEQLRIRMGGGYNYVSTIPSSISALTTVYVLCNDDASVLVTSPLVDYLSLTTSSWVYPDLTQLSVLPSDASYEASINIKGVGWYDAIHTTFTKIAALGVHVHNSAFGSKSMSVLDTMVTIQSLLPNGVSFNNLTGITAALSSLGQSGVITMNEIAAAMRQKLMAIMGTKTTDIVVVSSISRQVTNEGYATRLDFGVAISWVNLIRSIMAPSSISQASLLKGINGATVIKGFDTYFDTALIYNFTTIITSSGDTRMEVNHFCMETTPGYLLSYDYDINPHQFHWCD
jgi:hypothetical protein